MQARFFYAPHSYNTWPKVFVLTSDGRLYSEYLNFMKPATVDMEVSFEDFTASDFKWGGYQTMKECSKEEAVNADLTRQANWVSRYIREKDLE